MRDLRLRGAVCASAAVVAFTAVAAAPATSAASGPRACEAQGARPSGANDRAIVRATLCLLNADRARYGLRALRLNSHLSAAARRHSRDMARNDYFDHTSRNGSSFVDRIRRAGYLRGAGGWSLAENLAWGSGVRATPRAIAAAWMNSPGHRANILASSHREIGIGVVPATPMGGVGPGATYTADFGTRN